MALMTVIGFVLVKVSDHFTAPDRSENVQTRIFRNYNVIGQFCIVAGLAGVGGLIALFLIREI